MTLVLLNLFIMFDQCFAVRNDLQAMLIQSLLVDPLQISEVVLPLRQTV